MIHLQVRRATMKRLCEKCMVVIPPRRMQALPHTTTCIHCSNVKPRTIADVDIDEAAQTESPVDSSDDRSLGRRS